MRALDYNLLKPELFLLSMACIVLLIDLFLPQKRSRFTYLLTQISLAGAFILTLSLYTVSDMPYLNGLAMHDLANLLIKLSIYASSILVLALSRDYLIAHDIPPGEFYLLSIFSILGMSAAVSANHFLIFYLGIELMSLPLYAMIALYRNSEAASEAAIKYFVLGVFSSALLLYGISMLYGATHTLNMLEIAQTILHASHPSTLLNLALVFILAGLAFKLGVVPFHLWIPDVYEGAPPATTLFITVAPKIVAFALFYRALAVALIDLHGEWQALLIFLSASSIVLGNVAAILQTSIRRMLGYSTIAHGGYMLLGMSAATPAGFSASLYYALVYAITSIVGFGLISILSKKGNEIKTLDDLKGLSHRFPGLALIFMLALFSMAGIPPTAGFFAKLSVLYALMQASSGLIWLAILAIIFAVIGSYYYLRIVKVMYFDRPEKHENIPLTFRARTSLNIAGWVLLLLGLFPSSLMEITKLAVMG